MNSRDRRACERAWPHRAYLDDEQADECIAWLTKAFGSCNFKRRAMPRWCFRPDMGQGPNFVMMRHGIEVYFRKKEDYSWFLLKWEQ